MRNWISRLCVVVLACVVLSPGTVKAESDPGRQAGYFGIGLLHAWPEFGSEGPGSAYGFNARVGYQFLPFLASEVNVDFANDFDYRLALGNTSVDWRTRVVATTGNLKAVLPLGWFRPYLLGGIGFQWSQLRVSAEGREVSNEIYNFVGRAAGGFDFMFHDQIGWHIEGYALFPVGSRDFNFQGFEIDSSPLRTVGMNTGIRFVF